MRRSAPLFSRGFRAGGRGRGVRCRSRVALLLQPLPGKQAPSYMRKTLLLLSTTALLAAACGRTQKDPKPAGQPAACALVPAAGPCNAAFVRYYYDPKEQQCKPFTWGGCAGVVPFLTLQECQSCGCQ